MNETLIIVALACTVAAQLVAWAWAVGECNRAFEMRWKEAKELQARLLEIERQADRIEELEKLLALHGIRRRIPAARPEEPY